MKEESIPQPSKRQIAKLVKSLLGPEQEWDDAAAEFVLRLHGIDPGESKARLSSLVDKIIREKTDRGEEVAKSLRQLQSKLKAS